MLEVQSIVPERVGWRTHLSQMQINGSLAYRLMPWLIVEMFTAI